MPSFAISREPGPTVRNTISGEQHVSTGNLYGVVLLSLLVLVGAILRFHLLGAKSLWLVEAFSVMVARQGFVDFLHTMWWGEANMTLYYFLLRGWIHLGDSEAWLRSLSVLFGLAAIPAIYQLGSRFLNRKAGTIAAILLTINAFHIQYSQELRSYSLLMLLGILSSYAFLSALEKSGRISAWILYVLFSSLAIYAHMFAAFLIAAQWLPFLISPSKVRRLGLIRITLAFAGISILTAPVAAVVILEHKDQLNWVPPVSLGAISELVENLAGAGPAVAHQTLRALSLTGLCVATWIVACFNSFGMQGSSDETFQHSTLRLLVSWFLFPITAIVGISLFKPIEAPRYVLICLPAGVLLAAWGLVTIQKYPRWGRTLYTMVVTGMIILASWCTWGYYQSFKTYGHNGRAVASYILANQRPGDAVIFYTFSQHYVFDYYESRRAETGEPTSVPTVLFPLELDAPAIEKRTESFDRVWLVLHQTRATPLNQMQTRLIQEALNAHFRETKELEFPGLGIDGGETGAVQVALYVAAAQNQNAAP